MIATSPATATGRALVADRKGDAFEIGRRAGELLGDPGALVSGLRSGLQRLADPAYLEGQRRVAPGIEPIVGVRQPLLTAVSAGFRSSTRRDSSASLLLAADDLLREDLLELHWIAFRVLERTIIHDPEQSWQLVRAEARRAADWITVDSLARVAGRGILAEAYRWAELEQLVYSPWRWERRLVGSIIATIPFLDHTKGRRPDVARHGLAILDDLIGDAEPDVQKALAWALRSLTLVDAMATLAFLRSQAELAARTDDGHRAWVVRQALTRLEPAVAGGLRATVAGVRRRAGVPSTSRAARTAASFAGLGLAVPPAERSILARG